MQSIRERLFVRANEVRKILQALADAQGGRRTDLDEDLSIFSVHGETRARLSRTKDHAQRTLQGEGGDIRTADHARRGGGRGEAGKEGAEGRRRGR